MSLPKITHRSQWADIMKGLGIFAVVVGHQYSGIVHDFLYLFHLPLFFFLSAFFYKPHFDFKLYFLRQFQKLLIPYFVYLIVLYLVFNYHEVVFISSINELIVFFVKPIVGGRALVSPLNVFWFITVLFATQQLFNVIVVRCSIRVLLWVAVLFYVLSFINSHFYQWFWLPWNLNVVLAVFPFFTIGYIYQQSKSKFSKKNVVLLGVVTLASAVYIPNNTYDLKYSVYGIPFLTLGCSVILVLFLKVISEELAKVKVVGELLAEVGRASLVIMYLHVPLFELVDYFFIDSVLIKVLLSVSVSVVFFKLVSKRKFLKKILIGSK